MMVSLVTPTSSPRTVMLAGLSRKALATGSVQAPRPSVPTMSMSPVATSPSGGTWCRSVTTTSGNPWP